MFHIQCQCGAKFKLPADCLGRAASCPRCKSTLRTISGGGRIETFDSRLVIETGPGRVGEQFLLAGQGMIKIGKLEGKPIQLEGTLVSRNHCRLVRTPAGGWRIEDAKSTNGLFVNDRKTQAADLVAADRIRIGEYTLVFLASQPARQQPQDPPQDDLYALAEMETIAPEAPVVRVVVPGPGAPSPQVPAAGPARHCPSCNRLLPAGTRICVQCGIDLKTGRPLLTSRDINQDELLEEADGWIRLISWFLPFGLFPIASEAFATRKPLATWTITGLTVLTSLLFLPFACDIVSPTSASLNLMLWSGSRQQTEGQIQDARQKVATRFKELQREEHRRQDKVRKQVEWVIGPTQPQTAPGQAHQAPDTDSEESTQLQDIQNMVEARLRSTVPPDVGFRWYQPFTSALLHGSIVHLAGNLLFLLVFGLRVNELIGNVKMAIVYPLLAMISGLAHHCANLNTPMYPMLGASGAIMGLAGMYFVFFPIHKVHMAAWIRLGMLTGWQCFYRLFRMSGFWLLVLWIGWQDALPMALGSKDSVAHWAHLGGFLAGAILALGLLLARQINARGTDMVSMILGRRAWTLLGKSASD